MARQDDQESERATILRRRAQLVACAMVAGVGLPECAVCLSPIQNTGGAAVETPGSAGAPTSSGAPGENAGEGGQVSCLSISGGSPAGGEGGGGPTLCLSVK